MLAAAHYSRSCRMTGSRWALADEARQRADHLTATRARAEVPRDDSDRGAIVLLPRDCRTARIRDRKRVRWVAGGKRARGGKPDRTVEARLASRPMQAVHGTTRRNPDSGRVARVVEGNAR